jgi:hypothetical protein
MRTRKTIEIQFVKDEINKALASTLLNTDHKEALCTLIEIILLKKGIYNGFMFLDNEKTEILTNGYFSRKYF